MLDQSTIAIIKAQRTLDGDKRNWAEKKMDFNFFIKAREIGVVEDKNIDDREI